MTKLAIIILAVLLSIRVTYAQSDACSVPTVLSSFEAAALSKEIETWIQRYQNSTCSNTVKQGTRALFQGYSLLSGNRVTRPSNFLGLFPVKWSGSGNTVANYQGNLNVYRGVYPTSDLLLTPTGQDDQLDGYMYFTWDGGEVVVRSEGKYYLPSDEVPDTTLWDVIVGCESDNVIARVRWVHTQAWRGNVILNLLYVGIITADGRMCVATYDRLDGGVKLIDWIFNAVT